MIKKPKQGSIVLLPFPFSDLTAQKVRPALVISNEAMEGEDIIVCAITTQRFKRHAFLLKTTEVMGGSLPQDCYIRADKVVTLDTALIRKVIGSIPKKIHEVVTQAIEELIR